MEIFSQGSAEMSANIMYLLIICVPSVLYFIINICDVLQMTRLLIVVDSEVSIYEQNIYELQKKYLVKITADAVQGRSILDYKNALRNNMTSDTDVVLMMRLTCLFWEKNFYRRGHRIETDNT